jgi:hypothetical protein
MESTDGPDVRVPRIDDLYYHGINLIFAGEIVSSALKINALPIFLPYFLGTGSTGNPFIASLNCLSHQQ